jgi:hypothetical protein
MDQFAATYYLRAGWQLELKRCQVRTVVLPPAAPLITALRAAPAWKQIYEDSQAVILVQIR